MKVFFCETFDDGTVGGSHACMYNLIRHMDRSVISCTAGFFSHNSYVPRYRDIGIPVVVLPVREPLRSGSVILRKMLNWYWRDYRVRKAFEDLCRQEHFDLVVLNNSVFASLLFISVCKRLDIPVVVYERGIGYFKQKHIRATENIGASIPVSEAVRRFLLNYEFKTKVIEIIYDGLDPSAYINKRSRAEMKSRLHIPTDGKIIGIVGNIRPWKGQKYFVEAFGNLAKQHDNIYGLIIGGCAEEDHAFESGLKDSVRKAGLQDRLLFLGYRNDVPELLPILDVFVHASTKPEPFGMVILEAMAARIPIVATSLGGPREILNDGECGILVPPEDGKAIAAACNRYLHDSGFGQDTVNKAYERLMMNFHIHQTVEKTVDLFNRVAGSSSQLNG